MIRILAGLLLLLLVSRYANADGEGDNSAAAVRPVPPQGIEIPPQDRQRLRDKLQSLQSKLGQLASQTNPTTRGLIPDVEIFARAVDQALKFNEFFDSSDVGKADRLLADGHLRADELLHGKAPWLNQTGLVVRGYRSKIDDSVQPYGVVIPTSYSASGTARHRCDAWFHGRGEKMVELQFLYGRLTSPGEFTPPDTIVVHPFGRYCNANKLAGEVDLLEVLDHLQSQYRIDPDRVAVRGFSMGGAACWQFTVHYPTRWFASNPGAGFSETPEFLRVFQKETLAPAWYEKALWHAYDCPDWASNLLLCPTVAYSGENDIQKQAADIMAEACRKQNFELVHIIGPKTGHQIHADSKQEIERRLASLARTGRVRVPRSLKFTTYTLKYNQAAYLTVNALDEHWQEARVEAHIVPGKLILAPVNVSDLSIHFDPGDFPQEWSINNEPEIEIHWQQGGSPRQTNLKPADKFQSDRSWSTRIHRHQDSWQSGAPPQTGLRKTHDLQGPIDDALMDAFVFVKPSGRARHEAVEKWTRSELDHAISYWRQQMRGDAIVKADSEITDADIASKNLILWGDSASNSVIARIAPKLPIAWSETEIAAGERKFPAANHALILAYPNPLNSKRYVVLNSSFTYREYDALNNARQVPKLPDWAIVDLNAPPNSRWPGKIVDADFFDESWQLKPPHQ